VFTILFWDVLHGWHFLGKHLLLIKVAVEPESNKTFNNLLDLIVPMVSTTMMVTGVKFLLCGIFIELA
jgi:hypothetical protein